MGIRLTQVLGPSRLDHESDEEYKMVGWNSRVKKDFWERCYNVLVKQL
jgi:hypothetical protein